MDDRSAQHRTEELLGPLNDFERQHAPEYLYTAGNPALLENRGRVAVVGSRQATDLGLKRAARLATELVGADVIVISGLAKGIDSAAHHAAMKSGGSTIAVLGTPLDACYPKSNAALQSEIISCHLALTQFAPGSEVKRHNFPLRNRLMALIADATVIVEARDGSGTIHQAWEAIRLGRPLFLMKSVLDDKALLWPRELLDYGANALTATAELLDLLPTGRRAPPLDVPF